jgi:predicted MFS family arabinose efflux permease
VLGLLVAVNVFNHIDRNIMVILLEPVKRELGASDFQMGLLAGPAFAILYTFAGLPIARWADRGTRRDIIAVALAVWSGMTALCGGVQSYAQMLLARIGVGIGEAGCTPPAHSLISDLYPPQRRATALSIYALGISFGTLLGLAAGGWIGDALGWRMAFVAVGLPGVALALIVRTTFSEPERGRFDRSPDPEAIPLRQVFAYLWGLKALRHLLLAASLQTLGLAATGSWNPTFLRRVFDWSGLSAGTAIGLLSALAGGLGTFGGGWLSDRLAARDARWVLWLPALGAVLSIPFAVLGYAVESAVLAIALLAPAALLHNVYAAVGHAAAQSLAKPRMRALVSAIALFAMNLIGFGLGPPAIGLLNDALAASLGDGAIRVSLIAMQAFLAWAALHWLLAARTYLADLGRGPAAQSPRLAG